MSTTIRLTPHGEELSKKQLEKGAFRSPEEVVERALETLAQNGEHATAGSRAITPAEAAADILENRKGVTLGGIRMKDLIREGRRF